MSELKIGLIGLDTSHVPAFTQLLNKPEKEYHVAGAKVVAAYPGGSPDFGLSADRVEGFTADVRDNYGVRILESPAAVAAEVDAILLTSVDGRAHYDFFGQIAEYKRPTFIDKPFAVSSADARAIADLAIEKGIAMFSASSLRFAEPLVQALGEVGRENIWGADFSGPMAIEPTQPGLFWYGIHTVEMLYATFGRGCARVTTVTNEDHDLVTAEWADGRIGTIRGNRKQGYSFGALLHSDAGMRFVDASNHPKPGYAGLLERTIPMFRGGEPPIDIEETVETIRFIEAANESRETGKTVTL